ncbi:hypothetical protein COX95_03040 [bacterium CG_4_10_14_0_2_um_filter_33_32]|nr:MAG: hypothetical protein AUJ93_00115 [bacterium CG2_30_33_46]PIR67852.1 MAG: hypothetical protein COU50_01025 [bacterium CG10_big_fil_rev_8_21_14_0_10_33_18]PIU77176.1 MAG: hypothetical protein COS74_00200 [bacterium CG06_land_8_20_14_3_00_33_50]PIW81424.1 MAG: hypothetical protein COZ97_01840 [bacterium CG_4_8_14_3_um_filter_33_28]PIY85644.1 MAG: hypothetical protein COY76_01110 [bacterium CG_4_10_14_0_8_um_filter_33_57]PIZ85753.1 MAG: hypothetical protein COX95_03040 [bacterium CG_4_10_1
MIKLNVSKIIDDSIDREELTDEVDKLDQISLKIPDGVIADIKIKGKEKVACGRCLEDFEKDINKEFNQGFVILTRKLSKEEEYDKEAGFIINEKGDIDLE